MSMSSLMRYKSRFKTMNNILVVKMFSNKSSDLDKNGVKCNDQKKKKSKTIKTTVKELPKPPENCCQSGCDNCVWIQYVEELEEYFKDGGVEAHKRLDQLITDPSLKAFVKLQLKNKSKDN